jgi:hypothetical protein
MSDGYGYSLRCAAEGCCAPASFRRGGEAICALHRDAPAHLWCAITRWLHTHEWALRAAARAERLSSLEWVAEAPKAAELCRRRGYSTWAPAVERVERCVYDGIARKTVCVVREIDEGDRPKAWAYRLRRTLHAECLRMCDCLPACNSHAQTVETAHEVDVPNGFAHLATIVAAGMQTACRSVPVDYGGEGVDGPIPPSVCGIADDGEASPNREP